MSDLAKKEGVKFTMPLKVSGPWHSKLMLGARIKMEKELQKIDFRKPAIPIIANAIADYEPDPDMIKRNLVVQITSPVLWLNSMEMFISDG